MVPLHAMPRAARHSNSHGAIASLMVQVVKASVPLSDMFNYVSTLRGMSKGRAQYTMTLSSYEVVPSHIQSKVVESAKVSA